MTNNSNTPSKPPTPFTTKSSTTITKNNVKKLVSNNNNNNNNNNDWSGGDGVLPGREVIGPLLLMCVTPPFSIIFFHVCAYYNGNFHQYILDVINDDDKSFLQQLYSIWPNPWDIQTWKMILSFMTFQLILMKVLPGKQFVATITPTGHRPIYKANGMLHFIVNICTIIILDILNIFNPAIVYNKFGNIISSMNIFALLFCIILLIKGYVAPSSTDHGTNGNIIKDFYWGMELYPRIFGWDVKQFTNCRMGMTFWPIGIICFAYKNIELHDGLLQPAMAASVFLQLVYCFKFFHWEMGYMCSMDIQHDRAGYYICWGCLVWVPAVYTSAAFYLTTSAPTGMSWTTSIAIMLIGWLCIQINYESDHQRYIFRQTNGKCKIWGHTPKYITATYTTTKGDTKTSLLLLDGYWKISRHFHYVPEILASFFWSVPALNTGFFAPYFYPIYLTILLCDRAFRDDNRCNAKYNKYWNEYCIKVPYKILPGIV